MEWRESVIKGSVALTAATDHHTSALRIMPIAGKVRVETFCSAQQEARMARFRGEYGRTDYYYRKALQHAPDDIDSSSLAEILDGLDETRALLAETELELAFLKTSVDYEPWNSETRFRFANLLGRLGHEDDATREYLAALEHPETLCRLCLRDCLNNLGWSLYRQCEYAKALPWFKRANRMANFGPSADTSDYTLALENIILVYVALNLVREAFQATIQYVSRFGRLPWPERHELQKLNIDADALYIEHCGHAV